LLEARQLEEQMWEELQTIPRTVKPQNAANQVGSPTTERSYKSEVSLSSGFTGPKNFMEDSAFSFRMSIRDASNGFATKGQPPSQISQIQGQLQNSARSEVLQSRLEAIERKYESLIRSKLAVLRACKKISQELGRVDGYPLLFFRNQSEGLRKFQEKGDK